MINQYVITITTVDEGFFSHYDSTVYIDTAFNVNTAEHPQNRYTKIRNRLYGVGIVDLLRNHKK